MNKVWMCSGSTYTQVGSGYKVSESLPVGIYGISLTMTGYHLDKYADNSYFRTRCMDCRKISWTM